MSARNGPRSALLWAVPFVALAFLSLLIFTLTSWLQGVPDAWRRGLLLWLTDLDTATASTTVVAAAQIVAAVLSIAITVVAIVVELAANRYTHRITGMFVRTPANLVVMGFFVLTTLQCLWISATLESRDPALAQIYSFGIALAMGMTTLCVLLLLPYFAYVFAFVDPLSVVNRIRSHTLAAIRRAAARGDTGPRRATVAGIDQLEDVALNALEHKDRAVAMASVEALESLIADHAPLRASLPGSWFQVDGELAHDPDFVSVAPLALDEIVASRTWFEVKVLRQYHSLFTESLNRVRDLSNLIALSTRRIGSGALPAEPELLDLAVRFFNSYLRAAINARDVRTAYYVLHQYRLLAEDALVRGHGEFVVGMMQHFRYYGLLALGEDLPFLLEAVAFDVAQVTERALECGSPEADPILEVFLQVDKESDSAAHETSLRGVRRAQVQLASFLLLRGDARRARRVYEDMAHEPPERLASIRDELLAEQRSQYWEFTDRAVNFAWLPPDRRKRVRDFFEWFGDRLPPARD
jgi:hypothetical protein